MKTLSAIRHISFSKKMFSSSDQTAGIAASTTNQALRRKPAGFCSCCTVHRSRLKYLNRTDCVAWSHIVHYVAFSVRSLKCVIGRGLIRTATTQEVEPGSTSGGSAAKVITDTPSLL